MNRGLLLSLAVVVGAVVYLQAQDDDDALLAAPDRGRPAVAAGSRSLPAGPTQGVPTRGGPGRAAAAIDPWAAEALVQGWHAWRQRAGTAQPSAGSGGRMGLATPSAWAPVVSPASVALRPPAPAEVIVVAPPEPKAPAFPHKWVGRVNDGAVLSGPEATWVVHAGDVIEGQWRVEQLSDRRMSLTYLPLNQIQQVVMR
ncbi:MAG: hypothetical protein RI907_1991 [Pseudomonadota bacterium]|jgi:hypothetical protein